MTKISPRRKAIIDRINNGEFDPRPGFVPKRDFIAPPTDEQEEAFYEVARTGYGILYGKKFCGLVKRRKWGLIYYLTMMTYFKLGLRTGEGAYLRVGDFNFEDGCVWVTKADTKTGEPKGRRRSEIPVPLTPQSAEKFQEVFRLLNLELKDYLLSGGRRDKMGFPLPVSVDTVQYRFKEIAKATAKKYPELKIDPKKVFPYVARRKVATEITNVQKDRGVMASEILGHSKADGKIVLEHYDIHRDDELKDAMTKALDKAKDTISKDDIKKDSITEDGIKDDSIETDTGTDDGVGDADIEGDALPPPPP